MRNALVVSTCRTQKAGTWDYSHRNIGDLLVEAAEKCAKVLGFRELGSDSEITNSTDIAAHKALGFKKSQDASVC